MIEHIVCFFRGHNFVPFKSRNFGMNEETIPDWLYQCDRCATISAGLWAPAPWPEPPMRPRTLRMVEENEDAA